MHMHTCMHTHTHTETYLYFTYHIHTPQALMYIYVHTFMYVCVCFCNIMEYTRQGYIHACYMCMTMSSCMYMPLPRLGERHPRRATGAAPPCPPGPYHWPCVKPSAYKIHKPYHHPVKIHTQARQCPAPPPPPLPLPFAPPSPPLPQPLPLPRSRSACSFATAPDPPPCQHPSHHTPSLTRLVRYLQVQGARELGRLHQLRRRSLVLVGARQPQGRAAPLYVCVRKCVTSCMRVRGGGQGDGNSAKGKRG